MQKTLAEFRQRPLLKIAPDVGDTLNEISAVNRHVLAAMRERLRLKAYSESTIRTYINEMAQLLRALGNIPADELKPAHLKRYLVFCLEKLRLKENTLHSRINAMTPLDLKTICMYYYVYVLLSAKDGHFYTGYTSNLKQRLVSHIAGKVASTKNRGPLNLIYFEGCIHQQDATRREKYLKSGNGKIYLKNRLSNFLNPTG